MDNLREGIANVDNIGDLVKRITDDGNGLAKIIIFTDTNEEGRFKAEFVKGSSAEEKDHIKISKLDETVYSITFDANGGTLSNPDLVLYRAKNELISDFEVTATKEDKDFDCWVDAKGYQYNEYDEVTENLALIAKWKDPEQHGETEEITIDFNAMDDEESPTIQSLPVEASYEDGAYVEYPEPYRRGYNLLGWVKNPNDETEEPTMFGTFYPKDDGTVMYAVWELGSETTEIEVTYDYNDSEDGEDPTTENKTYEINSLNGSEIEHPVIERRGYDFVGWVKDLEDKEEEPALSSTLYPEDDGITMYAVWESRPLPTITYNYNKDNYTVEADYDEIGYYSEGKEISTEYGGSIFLGWYDEDDNLYEKGTIVRDDLTLYAKWLETGTLVFNPNGGTITYGDSSYEIILGQEVGKSVEEFPEASKATAEFHGWFTEKDGGDKLATDSVFGENSTESGLKVEVFAHWNTEQATVTFDPNGGNIAEEDATKKVDINTSVGTLPTPTKGDKAFEGWYTEAVGGKKITENTFVQGDVTYYAHWNDPISKVATLKLNKHTLEVKYGDPLGLTYTYSPNVSGVTEADFVWSSSDESVIKPEGSTMIYKGTGTTTLTISTSDGRLSDSCEVTVTRDPVKVTRVNFKKDNVEVELGDSDALCRKPRIFMMGCGRR